MCLNEFHLKHLTNQFYVDFYEKKKRKKKILYNVYEFSHSTALTVVFFWNANANVNVDINKVFPERSVKNTANLFPFSVELYFPLVSPGSLKGFMRRISSLF